MDSDFLAILVCPLCKGKLEYDVTKKELICHAERIAYPINDNGIPILLADEARHITTDEY